MEDSKGPNYGEKSCLAAEVGQSPFPFDGSPDLINLDWEIVRDHNGDQQTAYLDTRYNLQTHDGATIYLQTTGTRTGKKSVLEKLGDGKIGPGEYRMRLHVTAETGDERYSWLNQAVMIASAGRVGGQVIYDAYQVL